MKKGVKTIIAGAIVFICGAIVIPLAIILPFVLGGSHEIQFKAPGVAEVAVNNIGRYYLWNDFQTVYEGRSYNSSKNIPGGMEIKIREADGHLLEFTSDNSITMTSGNSSKNSIGYVEIEHPGKVSIDVSGGNEERIFSFSQSGLLKMFGLIVGGVGLSFIAGGVGVALIVWGIVKLVKAK